MVSILCPAKVNLYLLVGSKNPRTNMHELDSVMCPIELSDEIFIDFDGQGEDYSNSEHCSNRYACEHSISFENQDILVKFEITIADELERVLSYSGQLEKSYSELLTENNLIFRTVKVFFNHLIKLHSDIKLPSILKIHLVKRIPLQAGLGGGSSNSANLLKFLIRTFSVDTTLNISVMASELGDDVLPCLAGRAVRYLNAQAVSLDQYLTERGFSAISTKPREEIRIPILILKPAFGISTSHAFSALDRKVCDLDPDCELGERGERALKALLEFCRRPSESFPPSERKNWPQGFINDFQEVVENLRPELRDARLALTSTEGCLHCVMTGSGSALVGFFRSEYHRDKSFDFIRSNFDESWFCQQTYVVI